MTAKIRIFLAVVSMGLGAASAPAQDLEVWALRIRTDDLDKCARFYTDVLGFKTADDGVGTTRVLANGPARIVLVRSPDVPRNAAQSRIALNFRVPVILLRAAEPKADSRQNWAVKEAWRRGRMDLVRGAFRESNRRGDDGGGS